MNEPQATQYDRRRHLARILAKLPLDERLQLIGAPQPGEEEDEFADWTEIDVDWARPSS